MSTESLVALLGAAGSIVASLTALIKAVGSLRKARDADTKADSAVSTAQSTAKAVSNLEVRLASIQAVTVQVYSDSSATIRSYRTPPPDPPEE